jgi:hypothetical protein
MVAPTIPMEVQSHLPFVQFWPTFEEAVAATRKKFPKDADVIIFPSGGITFPFFH